MAITDSDRATPTTEAAWHACSLDETADRLHSDAARGLRREEAAARLSRHGPNVLGEKKQRSSLTILVHQFRSLIVALLMVACGVAVALGDFLEAAAILVVIVLNALIGFLTEWKAARALEELRHQAVLVARVVRDGAEAQIPAEELVPGDLVLLFAGDRVPADGRVVEQARLQVDEAALSGESVPVSKSADQVASPETPLGDRTCMVHLGTGVTDGRGKIMVTATGAQTEMGKIGALIDGVDEHSTPLEGKLAELSRALLIIVLVLCAVIVLFGWLRGNDLLFMVEVGISLAIAAVPEGLLAVTTMTLAVGMQRMAKRNALVRRLPAVESLGSTTVICSDKTGTLTRNEMTVRAYDVAGRRVEVKGTGYAVAGEFRVEEKTIEPLSHSPVDAPLERALLIGLLCNDARLEHSNDGVTVLGDPTEAALVVAAEKAGLDRSTLERDFPRIGEVPFDSETKRMVTVHAAPNGRPLAYVKGSPGAVLEASVSMLDSAGEIVPMTEALRAQSLTTNDSLAASALRVLGLAYRELPSEYSEAELTRDLIFVGLVGMMDPLRDEARETVAVCRAAGIRVVMITGDQEATAVEIARQLGLDRDSHEKPLRAVHARDLSGLDANGWLEIVRDAGVFARVSPTHKLQIVDALQRMGHVVAMTGDGVNDAPALRKADIGIAMGIRGTEVAKESAAMIITDDNFSTIVHAVEQGRIIVHNILRFIHFLFSCNFAEIMTVFTAIIVGWPLPLGVLQILWLNLVTDIFPAMALALEPAAPDVMNRPPRNPEEPLMTLRFGWLIVWQGLLLSACTLATFAISMSWYGAEGNGLRHAVTIAFMCLALAQTFHAFNARSRWHSALTSHLFTNGWLWGATILCLLLQALAVYVPILQDVLGTVPLTAADWGLVAAGSLVPVAVVELVKLLELWRRRSASAGGERRPFPRVSGSHRSA